MSDLKEESWQSNNKMLEFAVLKMEYVQMQLSRCCKWSKDVVHRLQDDQLAKHLPPSLQEVMMLSAQCLDQTTL